VVRAEDPRLTVLQGFATLFKGPDGLGRHHQHEDVPQALRGEPQVPGQPGHPRQAAREGAVPAEVLAHGAAPSERVGPDRLTARGGVPAGALGFGEHPAEDGSRSA
jgi:hypothetical protein